MTTDNLPLLPSVPPQIDCRVYLQCWKAAAIGLPARPSTIYHNFQNLVWRAALIGPAIDLCLYGPTTLEARRGGPLSSQGQPLAASKYVVVYSRRTTTVGED